MGMMLERIRVGGVVSKDRKYGPTFTQKRSKAALKTKIRGGESSTPITAEMVEIGSHLVFPSFRAAAIPSEVPDDLSFDKRGLQFGS